MCISTYVRDKFSDGVGLLIMWGNFYSFVRKLNQNWAAYLCRLKFSKGNVHVLFKMCENYENFLLCS